MNDAATKVRSVAQHAGTADVIALGNRDTAAVKPTKLDLLAAEAIVGTVDSSGVCRMRTLHGIALLSDTVELLRYTGKRATSRFAAGNEQRLLAGLLTYQQKFAPDHRWRLVEYDSTNATLTWACRVIDIPPVVDFITRTSRLAEVLTPPGDAGPLRRGQRVVRACNLTDPRDSILTFPDESRPARWCVADDPIRVREHAFPNQLRAADAAGTTAFAPLHDPEFEIDKCGAWA